MFKVDLPVVFFKKNSKHDFFYLYLVAVPRPLPDLGAEEGALVVEHRQGGDVRALAPNGGGGQEEQGRQEDRLGHLDRSPLQE